jgi:hypothetical protein
MSNDSKESAGARGMEEKSTEKRLEDKKEGEEPLQGPEEPHQFREQQLLQREATVIAREAELRQREATVIAREETARQALQHGTEELQQRTQAIDKQAVTMEEQKQASEELVVSREELHQAREEELLERGVNVSAREVTLRNREVKLNELMKSTEAASVDAMGKEENNTENRVEDKKAGGHEGRAGKRKAVCQDDDMRGEGGSCASGGEGSEVGGSKPSENLKSHTDDPIHFPPFSKILD